MIASKETAVKLQKKFNKITPADLDPAGLLFVNAQELALLKIWAADYIMECNQLEEDYNDDTD